MDECDCDEAHDQYVLHDSHDHHYAFVIGDVVGSLLGEEEANLLVQCRLQELLKCLDDEVDAFVAGN